MRWARSFALILLHLTGILLFCLGFFPSKIVLQGHGEFSNGDFDPQFNKLVVMVVDALRSDFVFSDRSSMDFLQGLIRNGSARGYTAFSNPPTVTLPRLKGITTGSTPNFLDAVLNVVEEDSSSTLAHQDSWLNQLKLANKTIHMYGDDTWIKLFPGIFDENEGTSSFFVSDFTEVDNNVTRHLDKELTERSWDCLILHYLGLDHIGHKGGPESVFMKPKQKEMDKIVERVYNSLEEETLFVVLGDHGMNEIGNHGGSSAGETSAALVFISDKLKSLKGSQKSPLPYNNDYSYYEKIQQIDLVPTISSLLHLPIPKNSLGVFIEEFLELWPAPQQDTVLKENLNHYNNFKAGEPKDQARESAYEHLYGLQSELTRSASNYNNELIYYALAILLLTLSINVYLSYREFGIQTVLISLTILAYCVTVFGSSLIEEEHQIWWWFTTFFITVFCYKQKFNMIALLILVRVVRGWNNSGQKFVGDTISSFLEQNPSLNWVVIAITISAYGFNLNSGGFKDIHPLASFVISFIPSMALFTFKLLFAIANGDAVPKQLIPFAALMIEHMGQTKAQNCLVDLSKMFFGTIGGTILIRLALRVFYNKKNWVLSDIFNLIVFLLMFETSLTNMGMFLALLGIKSQIGVVADSYSHVNKLNKIGYLTISLLILQNLTFYSTGQTNSLNTVDLSNAYNGVESYNILAVGILTFLSNFAGPIYWAFASLPVMFESFENLRIAKYDVLEARWITNALFYSLSTFFILGSCFAQRYHLFIWTVFSPKVLYALAWNFLMNFLIEIVLFVFVTLY